MMRRATRYNPPGQWSGEATTTLTLTYADRHRRRIRLNDDDGTQFLLDLPHATRLEEGGGLELEDSSFVRICAAVEAVTDIQCESPVHTARVAWHIGNRHAPVQFIDDGRLRILRDHVLSQMLKGLGAGLSDIEAPFAPEGGAYGQHRHGHDKK